MKMIYNFASVHGAPVHGNHACKLANTSSTHCRSNLVAKHDVVPLLKQAIKEEAMVCATMIESLDMQVHMDTRHQGTVLISG
jgi:hypothetical protein